MPLELTITNEQKIKVSAAPQTQSGRPARLDGALRVRVKSGNSTFTQDPASPLDVYLVSADDAGDTVYGVGGDADQDPNVDEVIEDEVTLHVLAARAANMGLVAGVAEPK